MSTIKPLDIYVGDVKVFPDVDLSVLGSPILQSDIVKETMAFYNAINTQHWAYVTELGTMQTEYWTPNITPMFMPVVEESDDSPWHTDNSQTYQNYWSFSNMYTLYEIPFNIDAKWLASDRGGSGAFDSCSRLRHISFDPNKPVQPFIMKDDHGNVVLKTEACIGNLFANSKHLESITGLVINDIQDFTYDTNYIQTGATLYYDDNSFGAGRTEYVDDGASFGATINTWGWMFCNCNKLKTLDVTFPSVMHTNDINAMFFHCDNLPDDQFPTLNLAPLNPNSTINIQNSFAYCSNLAHVPITEASWQYIQTASGVFSNMTLIHTVDIPANATHLDNINDIMPAHFDSSNPDNLIIRTESLMSKYKSGEIGDRNQMMAFNPADVYNSNPDWQLYFNMYVPDSQYQDWVDFFNNITDTERGQGTWFSDSYLHRVSEYVEP